MTDRKIGKEGVREKNYYSSRRCRLDNCVHSGTWAGRQASSSVIAQTHINWAAEEAKEWVRRGVKVSAWHNGLKSKQWQYGGDDLPTWSLF
jgi:hypothetical protein